MLTTSDKWKENINRDDRQCRAYVSLSETIISDDLFNYKIKDSIYDEDFIGSFVKKRCDINVLNKQNKYDFDNKQLKVYAGLEYDDESSEYLFLGTYIVTTATYDNVNYQSTLECYDLSTLFDVPYKSSVTYPCTIRQYLKACCDACNITLSNKSFNMEDVVLNIEPYLDEGSTYRDAIRQIAKTCLSCAQIINDELVITTVLRTNKNSDFVLNDYFELSTEAPIGPYNVLTLSRTPQEDNYVYPIPLPENPIEYRIENDVIVDSNRELFAPIMYNFINGLTFIPCSITLLKGRPEICSLDYFTFNDMEEVERHSIVFTHEFVFDGNFSSTISCTSKSQTQTNYKRAGTLSKKIQTTELWVDKAKGQIEGLIKDSNEQGERINQIITDIKGTTQKISKNEEDITTIKTTIDGLQIEFQKSGNNLLRNTMFYDFEGWSTLPQFNIGRGDNPPTGELIPSYWYCTKTSGQYENGVVYEAIYNDDGTFNKWQKTDILISNLEKTFPIPDCWNINSNSDTKNKYLSGRALNGVFDYATKLRYDNEHIWRALNSDVFDVISNEDNMTISFKTTINTINNGDFTLSIYLYDNSYDSSYYISHPIVLIGFHGTNIDNEILKYKFKIPKSTNVTNVYSSTTEPTDTSVIWFELHEPESELDMYWGTAKQYINNEWKQVIINTILKDQSGKLYIPYYQYINTNNEWKEIVIYNGYERDGNWKDNFIPSIGSINIDMNAFEANDKINIEFGDLKLEYGDYTEWSPKRTEVIGLTHLLDETGYKIHSGDDEMRIMTDEIAQYYKDTKTFYLNKTEGYMKNAKCDTSDIDGLVTIKLVIDNKKIYGRYIR
mgnify:CR=1 FL=1